MYMLGQHIERHVQQRCVRVASNHAGLQLHVAIIEFPIIEGHMTKNTHTVTIYHHIHVVPCISFSYTSYYIY